MHGAEDVHVQQVEHPVEEQDATNAFTRAELDEAIRQYNEDTQRIDIGFTKDQLIGPFTIICLILNRTIGSGIFETPPKVLSGVGSVGGALITWFCAGLVVICGVCCWLELGMSVPLHTISDNGVTRRVSTPRSGGEKNYLEYIYKRPRLFMPCVFGIVFLVLGNLAGNAVAFGINVMIAAGKDPINDPENNYQKGPVIALAITVLTVCPLIHAFSRKGGIYTNNAFAVIKTCVLVVIVILGWIHSAGGLKSEGINESPIGKNETSPAKNITSATVNRADETNFDPSNSFLPGGSDVSSVMQAFLYAVYPFSGFEQPFYVLSEVRRPRRNFPTSVLGAMIFTVILYMLVNVSYFCVVPAETYIGHPSNTIDMAGAFYHYLFDTSDIQTGRRAIAGFKAFSVFGNILVATYTAAKVKQEIAKEGIIPYSLFFASGHTTFFAKVFSRRRHHVPEGFDIEDHLENSPHAALGLHWFSSVFFVAVTAGWKPQVSYGFLVGLYSYTIVVLLGVLTAGGLLYLKLDSWFGTPARPSRRQWEDKCAWPRKGTWLRKFSVVYATVYFIPMLFLTFASFAPNPPQSAFSEAVRGYSNYLLCGVGLSSLLWGVLWWAGLMGLQWKGRWTLEVTRTPYIEPDGDGGWVQRVELVDQERNVDVSGLRRRRENMPDMSRYRRGSDAS